MKYTELGLVNTNKILADALRHKYAVPAFNFYNLETLSAILDAARTTHSPVILAVSESALQYMGDDMLIGMIRGAGLKPRNKIALHLDHGHSFESCRHAIDLGFSSVMIDASKLPLSENIKLTKKVVNYAHKHNVSVEAELGIISGTEDKLTFGKEQLFTNPDDVTAFVASTNVDSLAVAIGTSHGVHKNTKKNQKLRIDILQDIAQRIPKLPLVLHGASNIPQQLVKTINKFGGKISDARGISAVQLHHAINAHICKINVDSDLRLAFTAATRKSLFNYPNSFDPRNFLSAARTTMTDICIKEIQSIMGSGNKI